MILTAFLAGTGVATAGLGVHKIVQTASNHSQSSQIAKETEQLLQISQERLEQQKDTCMEAIDALGEAKLAVLNHSMGDFLKTFQQIKNVDFHSEIALDGDCRWDSSQLKLDEINEMVFLAKNATGALAGTLGGAAVAMGAYHAAAAMAAASTGTAISSLSGAAATNATLAYFGGGALAAGGFGMTGGLVVLSGIVAGPALLATGWSLESTSRKKLETAKNNRELAMQEAIRLDALAQEVQLIRRRVTMLYALLTRLDALFIQLIYQMEDTVSSQGFDYRFYNLDGRKAVSSCAATAAALKSILDTPLLDEEGNLTEESMSAIGQANSFLERS